VGTARARAKNTLRDVDAAVVEAAFASRMAELGEEVPLPSPAAAGQGRKKLPSRPAVSSSWPPCAPSVDLGRATELPHPADRRKRKRRSHEQALSTPAQSSAPPQPSSPRPEAPPQPEVQPVNNAVLWHVDKSALSLSEPRRYRDRGHLGFVAAQPCLLCGRQPSDAHHLRFMQARAMGRRVSDEFAVPLSVLVDGLKCRRSRMGSFCKTGVGPSRFPGQDGRQ